MKQEESARAGRVRWLPATTKVWLQTVQNSTGLDSHAQVLLGSELLQHCGPTGRRQPPCELLQVSASAGRGVQGGGAL